MSQLVTCKPTVVLTILLPVTLGVLEDIATLDFLAAAAASSLEVFSANSSATSEYCGDMSVSVSVGMCGYVWVWAWVWVCVGMCVGMCECGYVCGYVWVWVCVWVCVSVGMCVGMCVYSSSGYPCRLDAIMICAKESNVLHIHYLHHSFWNL